MFDLFGQLVTRHQDQQTIGKVFVVSNFASSKLAK